MGTDNITIGEIAKALEGFRKDVVSFKPPLFERIGGDKSLESNLFFDANFYLIFGAIYSDYLKIL